MAGKADDGLEPHFGSIDHPWHRFMRSVLHAVYACPYDYQEGPEWLQREDVKSRYAIQHFLRKQRVLTADDTRGHSELAFRRASGCDVHTAPDGGLYGLVDAGHPGDAAEARGRLARYGRFVAPDGLMLVFNAGDARVRRAVERHLTNVSCPNWYVHYGSGLYLVGGHGPGKVVRR